MKQMDFLNYLDQRLDDKVMDYDVALDWNVQNHSIEIVLQLFAENVAGEVIDDSEGVSSEEDIINFEDGILLVDKDKSIFDVEDYLAVIPYDRKKGLSKGFVNGLVDYLVEVLDEGMNELMDFLDEDSEDEYFELKWDPHDFQEKIDEYADELDEFLPYPKF